jgi:hypothetical protein
MEFSSMTKGWRTIPKRTTSEYTHPGEDAGGIMGKKANRERAAGGTFFRSGRPVSDAERERMHKVGDKVLQKMSTKDQVQVLADSLHQGRVTKGKLRGELSRNAVIEMRKGGDKLRKKKKPVTVEALLEEYRDPKNSKLRGLASEVGLGESFFVKLAEAECRREVSNA